MWSRGQPWQPQLGVCPGADTIETSLHFINLNMFAEETALATRLEIVVTLFLALTGELTLDLLRRL